MNVYKIARWVANSVEPEGGVWSRSTLFAQACLSKYVEYVR